MRLSVVAVLIVGANAFVPSAFYGRRGPTPLKSMASDIGIPCEDECAMESYPNLPPSVHPGVLSGQALVDLLNHAKENGKFGLFPHGSLLFVSMDCQPKSFPPHRSLLLPPLFFNELNLKYHRLCHSSCQLRVVIRDQRLS
jgi:hypothetical protein